MTIQERALLCGETRQATVISKENVELLVADKEVSVSIEYFHLNICCLLMIIFFTYRTSIQFWRLPSEIKSTI